MENKETIGDDIIKVKFKVSGNPKNYDSIKKLLDKTLEEYNFPDGLLDDISKNCLIMHHNSASGSYFETKVVRKYNGAIILNEKSDTESVAHEFAHRYKRHGVIKSQRQYDQNESQVLRLLKEWEK